MNLLKDFPFIQEDIKQKIYERHKALKKMVSINKGYLQKHNVNDLFFLNKKEKP